MIDENLVAFLLADTDLQAFVDDNDLDELVVAVGNVPTDDDGNPLTDPYVWIQLADQDNDTFRTMDCGVRTVIFNFNIECCSIDLDTAKRLARLVEKALDDHSGQFDSVNVDAVYVNRKDDDYEQRNQFEDLDMNVTAMDVDIFADISVEDN